MPPPGDSANVVRAAFDAFQRGDVDGVLARCDEAIAITQPPELVDAPSTQRGHAGVLEAFAVLPQQWDDFQVDVLDIAEERERVLVTTVNRGRSKDSGIEVETRFPFVFRVHAGKITDWRIFVREADARDAFEA